MKKTLLLLFLLITMGTIAKAGVTDSIGITKIEGKFHIKYLISPGETIYGISTRYGVSISTLLETNPELENGLKVGQVIMIPYNKEYLDKKAEAESNISQQTHTVQPGETLYSLAKKYNVSIGELLKWNGMELKAGQKLIIGVDESTSSDVATTETISTTETPISKEEPEFYKDTLSNELIKNVVRNKYDFDPDLKQVLIIPFDPHLYFSDADDEIAVFSKIHRTQVRNVFRKRLNTLLAPPGYETIWLMGGDHQDTLADLNKIYSSVTYGYQQSKTSPYFQTNVESTTEKPKNGFKTWVKKQKDKVAGVPSATNHDETKGKFFGVKVKDPNFFDYFQQKYSIDYYIFVNQFEVVTDYEHCLDRAANNFARYFITHFSILDEEGNLVAGGKFRVHYNSNSSYIMKIVADNIPKVAERILSELPSPTVPNPNAH